MEEFIDKLYKMKHLECIRETSNTTWLRVPGGWVLGSKNGSVFIPYNDEFSSLSRAMERINRENAEEESNKIDRMFDKE